jgi:MoaA/NifB/PqqE/SkfB family radical SAM enzyme
MNQTLETTLIRDVVPSTHISGELDVQKSPRMMSGFEMRFIHLRMRLSLLRMVIGCYRYPPDWFSAFKYLRALRRQFIGDHHLKKIAYAGGKYYMGLYTPGWNSSVYSTFMKSQLNDFKVVKGRTNRFNTVFMAVTKKCALQCEHCFEWEHLNRKDVLSKEKLSRMVGKLQESGVSQIQFSGGEPLLKIDWLVQVLLNAAKTTDFWVATSGFKLTSDHARALKLAGLTGVIVSLDHHLPEKHNDFRGFKESFYWVERAVQNAKAQDLVVALSLCATREFISRENLMAYMELAKKWGVSFVQVLEPKEVGHYQGKEVALRPVELNLLEEFFLQMNFDDHFVDYPIVTYHGQYQRKLGCFSSGVKGLYIDTDGDINPCPFCATKMGSLLDADFDKNLEVMTTAGCSSFPPKLR